MAATGVMCLSLIVSSTMRLSLIATTELMEPQTLPTTTMQQTLPITTMSPSNAYGGKSLPNRFSVSAANNQSCPLPAGENYSELWRLKENTESKSSSLGSSYHVPRFVPRFYPRFQLSPLESADVLDFTDAVFLRAWVNKLGYLNRKSVSSEHHFEHLKNETETHQKKIIVVQKKNLRTRKTVAKKSTLNRNYNLSLPPWKKAFFNNSALQTVVDEDSDAERAFFLHEEKFSPRSSSKTLSSKKEQLVFSRNVQQKHEHALIEHPFANLRYMAQLRRRTVARRLSAAVLRRFVDSMAPPAIEFRGAAHKRGGFSSFRKSFSKKKNVGGVNRTVEHFLRQRRTVCSLRSQRLLYPKVMITLDLEFREF